MSEQKKDTFGFFRIAKIAFPIIFRICPLYYSVMLAVSILHGLSLAVTTTTLMPFFDKVNLAIQGKAPASEVFIWFFIYAGLALAAQILSGIHNFMARVVGNRLEGHMSLRIHQKSSKIAPSLYEDPAKLDDINKAFEGSRHVFYFTLIVITLAVFYLPYFVYMTIFLISINPILVLSILIAFVPAILSHVVRTKILSKMEDQSAPLRREKESYENAICDISFLKETRILGGFTYIKRLYMDSIKRLNHTTYQANMKSEKILFWLNLVSLIGYGLVIVYAIILLTHGSITVGAFAAVYNSLGMVFGIMDEIVNRHIGAISQNYGTIRNFIRFLEMEEMSGEEGTMRSKPSVSIRNVSFQYPGTSSESLRGISLEIMPGETIAIVGENGAGKTTLVRLITGIYKPTNGEIEVGGLDVKKISPSCLYDSVTGVFQKYQRYKMTLDENIRISRPQNLSDTSFAAVKAGVNINDLSVFPKGIDTMLSREFDGTDLSGGEWQRIALARGFYRDHKLIVLDEPTAAIDPIEESRIYKRFTEITRNTTAIIVTHRMGSATIADRVVVMDGGKIVDIGTHEELMLRKGLYYEMFMAQSSWYMKVAT